MIMSKNSLSKNVILLIISASILVVCGCMGAKKTGEFVESLRNPTSFPEIFLPEVKDIDKILEDKSLAEGENVKIISLGNVKSTSMYLFQIRQDAEMDSHAHLVHDEILYFKKGNGLLMLDGVRQIVKEGSVVMIPRAGIHKYINTGEETSIVVSMFSPPFDGQDIKVYKMSINYPKKKKSVYDKAIKKSKSELKKEKGEERKWFGLLGKDEEKAEPGEGEEGAVVPEEQKILVLTEEGREKIRDARRKVNVQEKEIIDKIVLDEKLMVLQRLKIDGLISDEEFEATKAEIIKESGLGN